MTTTTKQTHEYQPFNGICLTDTFQLGESDGSDKMFSEMFPQNSDRVVAQTNAQLQVIIGNPPYSIGQKSANDNAQNQSYPKLDAKIASTYAAASSAGLNKSLYDAYIKAFRWSTDRLDKNGGIVCFVSNGAWLDGNNTDGFRLCLEKEFSSIYVFNLRGTQRTSGELSRKEGGKIFGSGSRTPIAISNIPAKAYEYVVNGKSAIEWIMERYQITTHKESGIRNDPNDWAAEVGKPRYILDLLLSIINVSVQTVEIVEDLPKVDFE